MIALLFAIILLCLAGGAFFAGMETGIISIHRMRLEHFVRSGSRNALLLQEYVKDSDRLLGTTLVGTNICVVVISVISASLATRVLGEWGEPVSTVIVSLVVLIVAEYMPKAWFHSRPIERSERYAGLLRIMEILFKPISASILWITRIFYRTKGNAFTKPDPFVTREDLKLLAREGEKDGILSPRERIMIHRVIELSGKKAGEVMVPREQIVSIERGTSIPRFLDKARQSEFTRMPIYDPTHQTYTGTINVFFVLATGEESEQQTVDSFAREPLMVPESMPADDILPRMRKARQPMCLVTDDRQAVTGLITTEDILRSIVGEL